MERLKVDKSLVLSILITIGYVSATCWLFYDFEWFSLMLLGLAPVIFKEVNKRQKEKRKWILCVQFSDALQFLKNGLDAGYSIEKSLIDSCVALDNLYGKKSDISKGFRKIKYRIETGFSIEVAMEEFGKETGVQEIVEFAGLFSILKRTGGDLNNVIRKTSFSLKEKIELRRELSVMVAAKAGEFRVMCIMPYAIIGYMKVFAGEMVAGLYHNMRGIVFMTAMLAVYCGCYFTGGYLLRSRLKA